MKIKKLVVILVVTTSLLAIVAFVYSLFFGCSGAIFFEQQQKIARMHVVEQIPTALTAYYTDIGHYPTTRQGLAALVIPIEENKEKWNGPYLKELSNDPWGNEYIYEYPGTRNPEAYDISSLGEEKRGQT